MHHASICQCSECTPNPELKADSIVCPDNQRIYDVEKIALFEGQWLVFATTVVGGERTGTRAFLIAEWNACVPKEQADE